MENLVYILPVFGIIDLVYMAYLNAWVNKQAKGNEKMSGIADHIAERPYPS